jgi:heavy metal sensor kinase
VKSLSIRARLDTWYSVILALSLCTFGAAAYWAMSRSIRVTMDSGLKQHLEGVRAILQEDAPQGLAALKDELQEYADGVGTLGGVRVADAQGTIIFSSPGMEMPKIRGQHRRSLFAYTWIKGQKLRVLRENVDAAGARYDVMVGSSTEDVDRALNLFGLTLVLAVPFFLLLGALVGDWMSRRALAPVGEITQAARNIGAKDLSMRLSVPRSGDELEHLAETLNDMLGRIENAFQRITRFTADASHELRTPVSVIRTGAELALRRQRPEREYRESLTQILHESEKVSQMIDELLILARADSGPAVLPLTRTNLSEPLIDACAEASPLAEAKHQRFSENLPAEAMWVHGDASSLERLFLILLDNAVKYTPDGGKIDVRLGAEDGFAVAEIRDTGMGIAPEHIPHVFDRFYRADPSRARESGGTGLGLAIGHWIAQAHHGEIRVASQKSEGSSFQVWIPLANE